MKKKKIKNINDEQQIMLEKQQVEDIDMLCNFYLNMSMQFLREWGYDLKVTHLRYSPDKAQAMMNMGISDFKAYLRPTHELRVEYELAIDIGAPQNFNYVSSNGGMTIIEVSEPGETNPAYLLSAVFSLNDPYSKKKGVQRCLWRVFNQLCYEFSFTKEEVVEAVKNYRYLTV